jgi:hypothetical protein
MTFEKWMDEISKGQEIRGQEIRRLDCALYDGFDEDDEEEEPKHPHQRKN